MAQATWLRERVNDPYGTPRKHVFWATVQATDVNTWRVFERDGMWFAYDTRYNAWCHFPNYEAAIAHVSKGSIDPWA